MRWRIAAFFAAVFSLGVALAQTLQRADITGDWEGTLKIAGLQFPPEFPVVLRIRKTNVGELTGTVSFPNTGGRVCQLTAISIDGSKIMFRADAAQATFQGTISQDNSAISGIWTDSAQSTADFHRVTMAQNEPKRVKHSDIDGYWTGTLKLDLLPECDPSFNEIRYTFHITNTAQGLLVTWITWDRPANGEKAWVATSVTRNDGSLLIEMKQMRASFHGMLNSEKTTINGIWTYTSAQGASNTYPFVLNRSKHPPKPEPTRDPLVCASNGASRF